MSNAVSSNAVINNLEARANKEGFFTERSPSFLKRIIPCYNSLRRIKLQSFTDDELERRGFNSEEINHDPLLDDLAVFCDVTLLGLYSMAAYGIYHLLLR